MNQAEGAEYVISVWVWARDASERLDVLGVSNVPDDRSADDLAVLGFNGNPGVTHEVVDDPRLNERGVLILRPKELVYLDRLAGVELYG